MAEHRKQTKRFVMVWSFNGRISGCRPEDTGSTPVQIANVAPTETAPQSRPEVEGAGPPSPGGGFVSRRGHIHAFVTQRAEYRSLKPGHAGSKPAGCTTFKGTHSKCVADTLSQYWEQVRLLHKRGRFRQKNVPCLWLPGPTAETPGPHPGNMGSNPMGVASLKAPAAVHAASPSRIRATGGRRIDGNQ